MKNGLIIDSQGVKNWYVNDNLHREDGPAVEYPNGWKFWYRDNQFHREDGPAFESLDGNKSYYYRGELINASSNEEFFRMIKLKAFW